jgi:hypothetical protein
VLFNVNRATKPLLALWPRITTDTGKQTARLQGDPQTHMYLRRTAVGDGVQLQYRYTEKISVQSPTDHHKRAVVCAKRGGKT